MLILHVYKIINDILIIQKVLMRQKWGII